MNDNEMDNGCLLTEAQQQELDRRYFDQENGIAKTYTWEETLAIAEQALKERNATK